MRTDSEQKEIQGLNTQIKLINQMEIIKPFINPDNIQSTKMENMPVKYMTQINTLIYTARSHPKASSN